MTDNETVFAVIPHIIRRQDLDEFNGRTLDVGTANSIHLRHVPGAVADRESGKASEAMSQPSPPVKEMSLWNLIPPQSLWPREKPSLSA